MTYVFSSKGVSVGFHDDLSTGDFFAKIKDILPVSGETWAAVSMCQCVPLLLRFFSSLNLWNNNNNASLLMNEKCTQERVKHWSEKEAKRVKKITNKIRNYKELKSAKV